MSDYSLLGLYEHNIRSYEKVKEQLKEDKIAAIVHATGTGKSFNALQLALDNKNKKILYVVPYNSIIEHEKEIIDEKVSMEEYFPNLEFRTYTSFINMSRDEIKELDIDILILDEFHHLGAPIWGSRINTIIETHPKMQVFGMTAYTVRDRGTSYERDMVNPETDELFSNKVVSFYDLCDAMIDGVLPKPNYKSGYVYFNDIYETLEQKVNALDKNSKDYKEFSSLLSDIKKRIHEAKELKDIFKANIKPNGKYIYFCPVGAEEGVNDIKSIIEETKSWIKNMGLKEDEYELYLTTSEMGKLGKEYREAFYKDEDLNHNNVKHKLRIMFAINQYNEGTHVPNLDGVILGRSTKSDIVFFEQLGRGLSVNSGNKEEYDHLIKKSKNELIELCEKRELSFEENYTKKELIDIILAPTIIDLSNNIGFIRELSNNLKERVRLIQNSDKETSKREIHLGNTSFNIFMLNENLFEVLEELKERLYNTWEDKYELAKIYSEHYGNLEVPQNFKTTNGYEYDEKGIALGRWIYNLKYAYKDKKLSQYRIELLEGIGMRFEIKNLDEEWKQKYKLAKAYYEHHGNLKIPYNFKTTNGYEYDEEGVALGGWIITQRTAYANNKLSQDRIKLLEAIGMRLKTKDLDEEWNKKYELAKKYSEHYGNLEISVSFKTINGYDYDEKGILLGSWITFQRSLYKDKKLSQNRIKLLKTIGMRFETNKFDEVWNRKYKLAKAYYEHYGNLEALQKFKTTNGYDYDEDGIALGEWIIIQRKAYANKKISQDRIKLLEAIGMRFETIKNDEEWNKKYDLAKKYYEHHRNLEIPYNFKTINGYDYDENGILLGSWILHQRTAYKTQEMDINRIKLLENIGMKWFSNAIDKRLQKEKITKDNTIKKQKELLNRFKTVLNNYNDDALPLKDELNEKFLEELNGDKKRR